MKSRFTPGEWFVETNKYGDALVREPTGCIIADVLPVDSSDQRPRSQSPRFKPAVAKPIAKPNKFDDTPASRAAAALLARATSAETRRDAYRGGR